MISPAVARKYAKALLNIGIKNGKYQDYGEELERFVFLFQKEEALKNCLESPFYDALVLKAVIEKVGRRLNLSSTVIAFLKLIVDKDRIPYIGEIYKTFLELSDEIGGRARVTITLAHDISEEALLQITAALKNYLKKEVSVEVERDAAIIGGIVARTGDLVFDGSVRAYLARLKRRLIRR